mmetsp:Transcript_289/g.299  ORF Transcript_289/g.299 Transcript_289/m.299 type:complete len:204 (-) Transcript_289:54-665(-)
MRRHHLAGQRVKDGKLQRRVRQIPCQTRPQPREDPLDALLAHDTPQRREGPGVPRRIGHHPLRDELAGGVRHQTDQFGPCGRHQIRREHLPPARFPVRVHPIGGPACGSLEGPVHAVQQHGVGHTAEPHGLDGAHERALPPAVHDVLHRSAGSAAVDLVHRFDGFEGCGYRVSYHCCSCAREGIRAYIPRAGSQVGQPGDGVG